MHAKTLTCSQLVNKTNLPFHYEVQKQGFHLNKNNTSPIMGFDTPYQYKLLDGEISVFQDGVQISKEGHFSIHYENIKVSSRHHCRGAYLIWIYN